MMAKGELLFEGGFGKVYKRVDFRDPMKRGSVAVKRVSIAENSIQSAIAEINILSGYHHDHLVKMISAGLVGKFFEITMEYYPFDLKVYEDRFHTRGIEYKQSIDMFSQIISAVRFLHSVKFIHLDLKPDNILVRPDEAAGGLCQVCVCDFGCGYNDGFEASYCNVGTSTCRPPENFICLASGPLKELLVKVTGSEKNFYSTRTDSFGCGTLLVYLLTRKHFLYPDENGDSEIPKNLEAYLRDFRGYLLSVLGDTYLGPDSIPIGAQGSGDMTPPSSPGPGSIPGSPCLERVIVKKIPVIDLLERLLNPFRSVRAYIENIWNHPCLNISITSKDGSIVTQKMNTGSGGIPSFIIKSLFSEALNSNLKSKTVFMAIDILMRINCIRGVLKLEDLDAALFISITLYDQTQQYYSRFTGKSRTKLVNGIDAMISDLKGILVSGSNPWNLIITYRDFAMVYRSINSPERYFNTQWDIVLNSAEDGDNSDEYPTDFRTLHSKLSDPAFVKGL